MITDAYSMIPDDPGYIPDASRIHPGHIRDISGTQPKHNNVQVHGYVKKSSKSGRGLVLNLRTNNAKNVVV